MAAMADLTVTHSISHHHLSVMTAQMLALPCSIASAFQYGCPKQNSSTVLNGYQTYANIARYIFEEGVHLVVYPIFPTKSMEHCWKYRILYFLRKFIYIKEEKYRFSKLLFYRTNRGHKINNIILIFDFNTLSNSAPTAH